MRARIHRGAQEVGGSCVEVEAQGARIVLDIGRPLWAERDAEVPLPAVSGLEGGDPSLLGIAISHGHPDHFGLIDQVSPEVPVYMGEAAARILSEAAFFTGDGGGGGIRPAGFLRDRQPLSLGPFTLTPYLVDHSAYDAYALLVEADDARFLYSGDLRAHGRKRGSFERLISSPPPGVDVLLMEGTTIGRAEGGEEARSEEEVEERLVEKFRATEGMALVCFSPQNIDRYVSVYRAALRADRDLVIDLYTATVAAASGRSKIPQAGWERVKVFIPQAQRVRVKEAEAFDRVNAIRDCRVFPEGLADLGETSVMVFRGSMAPELERVGCLAGASAVWSMWPGYLERESSERLRGFLDRNEIPLSVVHASGHATLADLKRLAGEIDARRVVPIHTLAPEEYDRHFAHVQRKADGEWWEV